MKVGDMVRSRRSTLSRRVPVGLVVEIIQKKCWRTNVQGKKINWDIVDPEPHAVVLYRDSTLTIPVADLEVTES